MIDQSKELKRLAKEAKIKQKEESHIYRLVYQKEIDELARAEYIKICNMIDNGTLQKSANEGYRTIKLLKFSDKYSKNYDMCKRLVKLHKKYKGVKIKFHYTKKNSHVIGIRSGRPFYEKLYELYLKW